MATSAMTAMNHALLYHSSEAARGAEVPGTISPGNSFGQQLLLLLIYLLIYVCWKWLYYTVGINKSEAGKESNGPLDTFTETTNYDSFRMHPNSPLRRLFIKLYTEICLKDHYCSMRKKNVLILKQSFPTGKENMLVDIERLFIGDGMAQHYEL